MSVIIVNSLDTTNSVPESSPLPTICGMVVNTDCDDHLPKYGSMAFSHSSGLRLLMNEVDIRSLILSAAQTDCPAIAALPF